MAYLQRKQIGFKATGTTVSVPNDPRAKLMYYLNCICTLIKMDDDPDINRLRRYRNYENLSRQDSRLLVQLCTLLSPRLLEDKCIFQSDAMCHDSSNEFYEVQAVKNNLLVAGNVVIGGRTRQVTKIMTYKRKWLYDNYTEPIATLRLQDCTVQ